MSTNVVAVLQCFVQSLLCNALMLVLHLQNLMFHTLLSNVYAHLHNMPALHIQFVYTICAAIAYSCRVSDNAYHQLPVMPYWCALTPTGDWPDNWLGNVATGCLWPDEILPAVSG